MAKYASKVVEQAKAWLGCKESDGSFKPIIDTYNSHTPLARGYKVKYTDEWCATFVSAVAVKLGYTDIIPTECSCTKMIALLKNIGAWDERDDRVPNPGDIMFYNWEAAASGDDATDADHVGIVECVKNGTITVIEGNYSQSVKRREIPVNHRYIRGYGVPKYDAEPVSSSAYTLKQFVKDVQKSCGAAVDGIAGPETISKTVTLSRWWNRKHNAVEAVQKRLFALGYTEVGKADGVAGSKFTKAVKAFQKANGCTVDGIITAKNKTWRKLLGME